MAQKTPKNIHSKMHNCYWGQCVGDALGSMVEFQTASQIQQKYPNGIEILERTKVFGPGTVPGQLTDDSEMAVMLLRSLFDETETVFLGYNSNRAFDAYRWWRDSNPIDMGGTTASALDGMPNDSSQANGALMRVSPLAAASIHVNEQTATEWLRLDASLTHPNEVCQQANVMFGLLIRAMLLADMSVMSQEAFRLAQQYIERYQFHHIADLVENARTQPPDEFYHNMGWVRIALHNALFHLFNDSSWHKAVHDTVMQGGDTDTNAAIVGSLLGARYHHDVIPEQWLQTVQSATPKSRPRELWAVPASRLITELCC